MSRKPVSTRTRFEIFKRDKFTCQYCGEQPPNVILHVDHILAVANGGTNDTENLTTACKDCNLGKSAVPLSVVPKSLEDAARDAKERAAQVQAHAKMVRDAATAMDDACWGIAELLHPGASGGWSSDKFNGVKMFIDKIGYARTLDAAYISEGSGHHGARRFRYFCGICWRLVREGQGL